MREPRVGDLVLSHGVYVDVVGRIHHQTEIGPCVELTPEMRDRFSLITNITTTHILLTREMLAGDEPDYSVAESVRVDGERRLCSECSCQVVLDRQDKGGNYEVPKFDFTYHQGPCGQCGRVINAKEAASEV